MSKKMIPFIDLKSQYQRIEADITERTKKVFEHGQFILGPEVKELEQKLANFTETKYCIGVANGTDALLIALMALDIKPGDEVIVPDFTFIAPAEMVAFLGAKPVFVDIKPNTYNLDANLLEQAITNKTKAIIAVSLYGQCADFDAVNAIASNHNLPVIEDAAQSFGATYKGRYSCNLSTIACTSFFPSKPLGCYGDGGACLTNDDLLAEKMRCIANHGQTDRYNHSIVGLNSRLDTLQAAVLLAKLEIFSEEIERRVELAEMYNELLKDYMQISYIEPYNTSVFAQYTIRSDNREKIIQKLRTQEIPIAIHYQKPLHQQIVFKNQQISANLSNSKKAAEQVLSLPFSPYLTKDDLRLIARAIIETVEDN